MTLLYEYWSINAVALLPVKATGGGVEHSISKKNIKILLPTLSEHRQKIQPIDKI